MISPKRLLSKIFQLFPKCRISRAGTGMKRKHGAIVKDPQPEVQESHAEIRSTEQEIDGEEVMLLVTAATDLQPQINDDTKAEEFHELRRNRFERDEYWTNAAFLKGPGLPGHQALGAFGPPPRVQTPGQQGLLLEMLLQEVCTKDLLHGKCFTTGSGSYSEDNTSESEMQEQCGDPRGCDICHMLAFLDRHKNSWDTSLDLSPMTDKIVKLWRDQVEDRYVKFCIDPTRVAVAGSVNDQEEVFELHVVGQLGSLLWEEYGKSRFRGSEMPASCRR